MAIPHTPVSITVDGQAGSAGEGNSGGFWKPEGGGGPRNQKMLFYFSGEGDRSITRAEKLPSQTQDMSLYSTKMSFLLVLAFECGLVCKVKELCFTWYQALVLMEAAFFFLTSL